MLPSEFVYSTNLYVPLGIAVVGVIVLHFLFIRPTKNSTWFY